MARTLIEIRQYFPKNVFNSAQENWIAHRSLLSASATKSRSLKTKRLQTFQALYNVHSSFGAKKASNGSVLAGGSTGYLQAHMTLLDRRNAPFDVSKRLYEQQWNQHRTQSSVPFFNNFNLIPGYFQFFIILGTDYYSFVYAFLYQQNLSSAWECKTHHQISCYNRLPKF